MSITQNGILMRDDNGSPVMGGTSSVDNETIINASLDPTTRRLNVDSVSSGITSINGDTTSAQVIAGGTGISVATVSGTTTITNTGSAGTVTSVSVTTANGVSGTVATATTTPAITLSLGAITPSAVQITGLTASEILATDASSNVQALATATYPSLTELSYVKGVTSAIQTQINAKGAGTVTAVSVATANGFSGSSSGGTTPSLTIVAGAITPTSVNGLTISTSTGTLSVTNAKTLSVSNTLTLAGTDSTTMTFPSTSASVARTDAAQTFTGVQTFTQVLETSNAITATSNAATIPITSKINTVTNNSAATLTLTFTTSGAIDGQLVIVRVLDATNAAQTLTLVNTENSTVTPPASTNGSTTLPLTLGLQFNSNTTKWRVIASA